MDKKHKQSSIKELKKLNNEELLSSLSGVLKMILSYRGDSLNFNIQNDKLNITSFLSGDISSTVHLSYTYNSQYPKYSQAIPLRYLTMSTLEIFEDLRMKYECDKNIKNKYIRRSFLLKKFDELDLVTLGFIPGGA